MKLMPNRLSPSFLWYLASALIAIGMVRVFQSEMNGSISRPAALLFYVVLLLIFCIDCLLTVLFMRVDRHQRIQYLLIEQMRLAAEKERTSEAADKEGENKLIWPWGNHSTVHLEHLRAAAEKFWVNYDPSDPSTAPTNEMVKTWLVDERAVSRDKAAAIASILRADSLPPGPRR